LRQIGFVGGAPVAGGNFLLPGDEEGQSDGQSKRQ
jgi:hypothetical protein